jgi:hypothetical protein
MIEAQAQAGRPPSGPAPPAPPATGDPQSDPDPADPGPPIQVTLGNRTLGDLGNQRVDAQLLSAILLRDGAVAKWLRSRGVDLDGVRDAFPGLDW